MRGSVRKVPVSRQQPQLIASTKLNQLRIDGADLDPRPSACVSNFRRGNVVLSIGLDQGSDLNGVRPDQGGMKGGDLRISG